ncbi:MAG: type I restriction endonuclease subunit R [Methylacidiphilales bacterium]|nr:type I restriction endonuclease subunit R [Candidatus Methylacidiphilales bacterium]
MENYNPRLNIIAQNTESTVVAEYISDSSGVRETGYQNELMLERELIVQLQKQGYEYLSVSNEVMLIDNLRIQLEKLNTIEFTDSEWERFFSSEIANANQGSKEKTRTIQEDCIKSFKRNNGEVINISLVRKENIHDNILQVINQYEAEDGQRKNRYDVTILVNGLPLVQIELKKRGVAIQEAFNQINRYARESFCSASGLFEYVQLFVISNGTHTKYYSNTTRAGHIKEQGREKKTGKQNSHSFEFTSWWADSTNKPITDLIDFTKTFFAKHTILNILTKYCVFTADQILMVMRPYQIVATEKIINKILIASNYKKYGSVEGGGYIWHTTGSGKTLTSFKTSQLISKLKAIDKVLFVVDRKDLDYQTMREYEKYEPGAANSNTSTQKLQRQLENSDAKIIITTIQKLSRFIQTNKTHGIYSSKIVIIFDECHRSQFGEMHMAITKAFKNYFIFGFTGTPIFAVNASTNGRVNFKTTEQAFGDRLHTYTIVDAINDRNVLPFRVDYVSTIREKENIEDKHVLDIDRERAFQAPERISNVVKYIREHFDQKTKRNDNYRIDARRLNGFNSIFAVSSIEAAKAYYSEFQKQMKEVGSDSRLKIAIIYSFGVNDEVEGTIDENSESTENLEKSDRDFLDNAIKDYNTMFKDNFDTTPEKFQNYYKDVSKRVKAREVDLLIVVNMFLTGFDATTLNTLWADKNLRLHGLLQAYSRTNRILNSIKTFGNIVCFRPLEEATNESIALFGNKESRGVVLLKTYREYYDGYTDSKGEKVKGYIDLINELVQNFPIGTRIESEEKQKEFIKLYGSILKLSNILDAFDEFSEEGQRILTKRDIQDYHSMYIDLYTLFRRSENGEKENINDDIVFEMELLKQVDITIDYILALIEKYYKDHMINKEILGVIGKAIDASVELRNKKDLIIQFIDTLHKESDVDKDWSSYIEEKKFSELDELIKKENLNKEETYKFIQNAFIDGRINGSGTVMDKMLPAIDLFADDNQALIKKESILKKLQAFFDRFFGV